MYLYLTKARLMDGVYRVVNGAKVGIIIVLLGFFRLFNTCYVWCSIVLIWCHLPSPSSALASLRPAALLSSALSLSALSSCLSALSALSLSAQLSSARLKLGAHHSLSPPWLIKRPTLSPVRRWWYPPPVSAAPKSVQPAAPAPPSDSAPSHQDQPR